MVDSTVPMPEVDRNKPMDNALRLLFALADQQVLHLNRAMEIAAMNPTAQTVLDEDDCLGAHVSSLFPGFSQDWFNTPKELRCFLVAGVRQPANLRGIRLPDKEEWVLQFQLLTEKFVPDEKLCRFLCDASGRLHWTDANFPTAFGTTLEEDQPLFADALFACSFADLVAQRKLVVLLKSQEEQRRTARIHLTKIPYTLSGEPCYLGSILFIEQSAKHHIDPALIQILHEETSGLAKVGGWYMHLGTGETHFTEVTRQIHELESSGDLHVGSGLNYFATPEAKAEITEKFGRLVQQGEAYDLELPFITAKGRHLWVRTMGKAIAEDGIITAVYGAIQDISEEHASMEALSNHNERLSNFAHIVSHNLRSHTANLSSLIEAIEIETDPTEKLALVALLKVPSAHLNTTINALNQVVTMPRTVQSGLQSCTLLNHLKQSLNVLAPQIEAAGVEVTLAVDEALQVWAVPAFLEGIWHNLITNAVKYRDPARPAVLEITAEAVAENKVRLRVRDNGLGIDMSKYGARIFGMYKTFHGNKDALGLGLFMTKNQVDAMNGKITLESEVGVGTVVEISLQKA